MRNGIFNFIYHTIILLTYNNLLYNLWEYEKWFR